MATSEREDLPLRVYIEAPEADIDMLYSAIGHAIQSGNITYSRELQMGHLPVTQAQSVLMAYELSPGFDEVWLYVDEELDKGQALAAGLAADKRLPRRYFTSTPNAMVPFVQIHYEE